MSLLTKPDVKDSPPPSGFLRNEKIIQITTINQKEKSYSANL